MTRPGRLLYRCRRCGLVSLAAHVPDIDQAIASILTDGVTPSSWGANAARATEVHSCSPGIVGVTDLIGAVADWAREEGET